MYSFIKKILFTLEPEKAHYLSLKIWHNLHFLMPSSFFTIPNQPQNFMGIRFKNPFGLAAGFDKNGQYLRCLEKLGFGFIEVGTVTPKPQPGNPQPRLLRITSATALINRLGFNNLGVDNLYKNLSNYKNKYSSNLIVGGNIGKNKDTPLNLAVKDYLLCFKRIKTVVDYVVINISSPNTPNLRQLQNKEYLENILQNLQDINTHNLPLILKISPDIEISHLSEIAELCSLYKWQGLVVANTTLNRTHLNNRNLEKADKFGEGGLSGPFLKYENIKKINFLKKQNLPLTIIACGGIFTADDIQDYQAAGANLFQVWTSFIYRGPQIVKKLYNQPKIYSLCI